MRDARIRSSMKRRSRCSKVESAPDQLQGDALPDLLALGE
jgi:hypothetical protein